MLPDRKSQPQRTTFRSDSSHSAESWSLGSTGLAFERSRMKGSPLVWIDSNRQMVVVDFPEMGIERSYSLFYQQRQSQINIIP